MTSRTVQLSFSGLGARIIPDGFSDSGYILEIGGAEQSHVDLADPTHIFYEYLRRIGNMIDVLAPAGEPLTVAHLGAGALTLARYLQATRPGSAQIAVDIERELPSLVIDELPLPAGTRLNVIIDDARAVIARLTDAVAQLCTQTGEEPTGAEPSTGLDAVILDIFSGWSAPEHLTEETFYRELRGVLSPEGVMIINVGDDPGFSFFTVQACHLLNVCEHVWCLTEANMLDGKHPGNLILVGTSHALTDELRARLTAAGPHPAVVLDTFEVGELIAKLEDH